MKITWSELFASLCEKANQNIGRFDWSSEVEVHGSLDDSGELVCVFNKELDKYEHVRKEKK
jgi:hypothetical protein